MITYLAADHAEWSNQGGPLVVKITVQLKIYLYRKQHKCTNKSIHMETLYNTAYIVQ